MADSWYLSPQVCNCYQLSPIATTSVPQSKKNPLKSLHAQVIIKQALHCTHLSTKHIIPLLIVYCFETCWKFFVCYLESFGSPTRTQEVHCLGKWSYSGTWEDCFSGRFSQFRWQIIQVGWPCFLLPVPSALDRQLLKKLPTVSVRP